MTDAQSAHDSIAAWLLHPRHAIVLLAVAGGTLFAAFGAYHVHREYVGRIASAGTTTRNLARVLEEHARQSLGRLEVSLSRATDEAVRAGDVSRTDQAALRQRLIAHLPLDGLISSFAIVGRDGLITLSTRADDPRSLPTALDRDYFLAHRDRAGLGMVIGAAVRSRFDDRWIVPASRRLDVPGGGFAGVLLAVVDSAYFQRFYDSIDTGANGLVTLFLRQGGVVVRSPFDKDALSRNWADSPLFRVHLPRADAQTVRQKLPADGVERIYSYRALKDYPLIVSLGLSLTDVLAPWRAGAWRQAILLATVCALLAGATWALSGQLRRREAAEAALRKSEARFRSLTELSSDFYWEQDEELRFVPQEHHVRRRSTVAIENLIGKRRWELPTRNLTEEDWKRHRDDLEAHREFRNLEIERPGPAGETRWVSISGRPIFDPMGRFSGYHGIGRNITERKRAEHALNEARRRLEIALENSQVSVWETDLRTNETWLSSRLDADRETPAAETRTTTAELLSLVHPEDRQSVTDAANRVATGEIENYSVEFRVKSESGAWMWLLTRGRVTVRDADGRALLMSGTNTDITERKRAEEQIAALNATLEAKVASRTEELGRALDAAAAANRMKSDFMTNVTHELRTPLNSVIGFAEMLKEEVPGPLNAKQAGFAADILAGGQRLLVLVEGILEMSRLDSAGAALRREAVDIGAALEERVAAHHKAAAAQGVTLRMDLAPDAGSVDVDAKALRRMLDALVDNAIRFNHEGGAVTLSARRNGDWLEIGVADTGIGIAREDLPRIFEPLTQIDSGLARRHGGVGLGLTLARRLMELHGGRIEANSEPGQGSTFTLLLPIQEKS